MNIAFIGLGNMGSAMAIDLRTRTRADELKPRSSLGCARAAGARKDFLFCFYRRHECLLHPVNGQFF
jgi:pyrroline-5-carboxylate reductase